MESMMRTATMAAQIKAKSSVLDDMGRDRMWFMVCICVFLGLVWFELLSFVHEIKQRPFSELTDTGRIILAILIVKITAHDFRLIKRTIREEVGKASVFVRHEDPAISLNRRDSLTMFCVMCSSIPTHDIFCFHYLIFLMDEHIHIFEYDDMSGFVCVSRH